MSLGRKIFKLFSLLLFVPTLLKLKVGRSSHVTLIIPFELTAFKYLVVLVGTSSDVTLKIVVKSRLVVKKVSAVEAK